MSAPVPKCPHCHDTGSLSKDIEGQLDCVYCGAALERVGLNAWCRNNIPKGASHAAAAWLIYRKAQELANNGNP
jgi:hypothetical protein